MVKINKSISKIDLKIHEIIIVQHFFSQFKLNYSYETFSSEPMPIVKLRQNSFLDLRRSFLEIFVYNIIIPILALTMMGICFLYSYGLLPAFVAFFLNVILSSRYITSIHELIHEPDSKTRWNWLLKLNILVDSPFTVGFNELRQMHQLHHIHTNTDKDPDYFLVRGSRIRSLLLLAFVSEYYFFYILRRRKFGRSFLLLYVARLAIFTIVIYIIGLTNFFIFAFLPSKLAFSLSFFIFSHEAHKSRRGLHNGIYNLTSRFPFVHNLLMLVIGRCAYYVAHDHATHHQYPWVSGRKLRLASDRVVSQGLSISSRQAFY